MMKKRRYELMIFFSLLSVGAGLVVLGGFFRDQMDHTFPEYVIPDRGSSEEIDALILRLSEDERLEIFAETKNLSDEELMAYLWKNDLLGAFAPIDRDASRLFLDLNAIISDTDEAQREKWIEYRAVRAEEYREKIRSVLGPAQQNGYGNSG